MYALVGAEAGRLIVAYLPWVLSAITIWMTILAGNKAPHAWLFGLANQALWLVWIVVSGSWGLIPMNLALWVLYARNHLKWSRMNRPAARTAVNAALDARVNRSVNPLIRRPLVLPIADLGLTARDIEKRDRPTGMTDDEIERRDQRFRSMAAIGCPAHFLADDFGDEGLTLAQKRRREEALSYGR